MNNFFEKKILLIICGGISAYKSLELIRLFKKKGASVKTILTKSAKEFVTPLSIVSLSQEKVYEDLFSPEDEAQMDHIALSRWSDVILVAPATANTISKLSTGSTEDLASTVISASDKDIFLAPAMNVRMWEHPSTKENVVKLKNYGFNFIGPEIGDMACGEFGEGKMSEPKLILLDEPMAGVNPVLVESLLAHIENLRDEGVSVLFIEHDMDAIMGISDWIVVLAEGRIIAEGPPSEVSKNPAVIDAYLGSSIAEELKDV